MKPYYKETIGICEQAVSYDKGYAEAEQPMVIAEYKCDVQPSSKQSIYNTYGYYIDCKYNVYLDNVDMSIRSINMPNIDMNSLILYEDEYYKVVKLIKWHNHTELFISPVESE